MSDYASVCVLSFNRPYLLQPTLDSMLDDPGGRLELIVHDDGSNDPELLDYLVGLWRDGRISTLILNPPAHNQGQGTALNRMFHMASGDPIIKCDHDLIFRPGWLNTVNRILDRNAEAQGDPMIGLLGLLHYHHEPVDSAKTIIGEPYTKDFWSRHTHILGSGFAVRRDCWEELGPFEEHSTAFAEDWMFQRKVHKSTGWCCGLPLEDVCENVGMGYGPSTVNVQPGGPDGPAITAAIHDQPLILGGDHALLDRQD